MVVAALEQGRQALLVRRGGLDDPGQRFSAPRSGPFWLYPTLFHERGSAPWLGRCSGLV